MTNLAGKLNVVRAALLALAVALVLPTAALAQGRGRGKNKVSHQEKKDAKFKNGHDARDGRWDGRGPRDRDDWDDDDDYDDDDDNYRGNRRRNRNRDRDNDGVYDRNGIRDRALRAGYNSGYSAGRSDRARGEGFDYDDHSAYRNAGRGYNNNSSGDAELYRNYFRQGFRQGYEEGYRGGSSRGGRWGGVLGDILGRP